MPKVDQMRVIDFTDGEPNTWVAKAPMPTARSNLALAAAGNGKLYAVGGFSGGDNEDPNSAVAEYDPATDAWTTRALMPTPRSNLGLAAARNGKLL